MGLLDETINAINGLNAKSIAVLIPIIVIAIIIFPVINALFIVPTQINVQYELLIKLDQIGKIDASGPIQKKLIESIESKANEIANPKVITFDFTALYRACPKVAIF